MNKKNRMLLFSVVVLVQSTCMVCLVVSFMMQVSNCLWSVKSVRIYCESQENLPS